MNQRVFVAYKLKSINQFLIFNLILGHFHLGNDEIADLLIRNGANIHLTDKYGKTALHLAPSSGIYSC